MFARTWLAVALVIALVACAAAAVLSPQARGGELAACGKLRAAINCGNPVLARKDGASGGLRRVTVDLSRELARRLDVPVDLVGFRILDGRFTTSPHAIGVPAGRRGAASYLDAFVGEAEASGFAQRSIEAQGLRGVLVPRATAAR